MAETASPQASGGQASGTRRLLGWAPSTLLWVALALVLTLLTFLVFRGMERFEPVATPWPFDPRFETIAAGSAPPRGVHAAAAGWEVEGDLAGIAAGAGVLRLTNRDPEQGVGVRQVWHLGPNDPRAFRLEAVVASEGIKGKRRGFRVGEITLVADRDIERPWFYPVHRLVALRGTQTPERVTNLFRFAHDAQRVELAIRLRHATGQMSVRDLKLTALVETPAFHRARLGLTLAWAGLLAAGAWLFWRGMDDRRSGIVLAAAGGVGLALLLMPQSLRSAILRPMAQLVAGLGDERIANLGHFAVFAVAGLLLRLCRRQESWLDQILLLLGLAGLTELLQFMAELRTPALNDWLTNTAGGLAGWLLGMLCLLGRRLGSSAAGYSSTTLPPQAAKQRR